MIKFTIIILSKIDDLSFMLKEKQTLTNLPSIFFKNYICRDGCLNLKDVDRC